MSSTLTKSEMKTLKALIAKHSAAEPAVPAKKVASKTKGARKTPNRKPVANGAVEGKRCLTSSNRKQFIADHDWAKAGTSTRDLAVAVVEGAPLTGDWAIGPRRVELITGKAEAVVAEKAKGKRVKKAGKHKADTGLADRLVEVVVVEDKPKATVFRRANGQVAPKTEWPMRAALEAQGLGRAEVDEKTALALSILNG